MTRVLILCAHRPGRSPSQRYRFEQYLPHLETMGYAFTWSYLLNEKQDRIFYSQGNFLRKVLLLAGHILKRIRDWTRFGQYDIIFIQREALFIGSAFFEKRAAASRARLIFDFDDSIWLADTSPGNKRWERIKRPAKFFDIVRCADMVIAGNAYLAEKACSENPRVMVIPTTVDTGVHVPLPQLRHRSPVVIGWSGSVSTVKHFEMIVPVLLRIHAAYGDSVAFHLVGDAHYSHPGLPVRAFAWSADTEVERINAFDIGIMPLPDDEWSRGKCGLKAISYMACGVPCVMSAVGVNREIADTVPPNSFLAADAEEWYTVLCRLIESDVLRSNVGYRARETVLERYSVKANLPLYERAFNVKDARYVE